MYIQSILALDLFTLPTLRKKQAHDALRRGSTRVHTRKLGCRTAGAMRSADYIPINFFTTKHDGPNGMRIP